MDVRVFNFENPLGFRLAFTFKQNEYFIDTELTKDYFLKCEPAEDENPLLFEGVLNFFLLFRNLSIFSGPEVMGCQGCKIHWRKNRNLTLRPIKKVQNHKIVTKWARKNSFFNFFTPPKLSGSNEDIHYLKRRELLEAHFQLGLFFKEQVIPKAYLFFTRDGYDSDMKSAGSKVKLKKPTRLLASSGHKTPTNRKSSTDKSEDKPVLTQNEKKNLKGSGIGEVNVKSSDDIHSRKESIPLKNGYIKESLISIQDQDTEIVASVIEEPKEEDPLPGRYLMESSENFDDFMKALGVGMIKRKLANSVIPINEIEISDEEVYTIRTITTVRTSEISFKLNEPFTEDTIDGRKTQTTPTREGNLLKLEQKGNKGEKDSVMTRQCDGDIITMKLIVDNIVCTRIYKRIVE